MRIVIEIGPNKHDERHLTRQSWARVRGTVKLRDRAICQYCGKLANDGEPDHILPLAKGGNDALENLVWSCKSCNQAKGEKTLREWMKLLTEIPAALPDQIIVDIAPEPGGGGPVYM